MVAVAALGFVYKEQPIRENAGILALLSAAFLVFAIGNQGAILRSQNVLHSIHKDFSRGVASRRCRGTFTIGAQSSQCLQRGKDTQGTLATHRLSRRCTVASVSVWSQMTSPSAAVSTRYESSKQSRVPSSAGGPPYGFWTIDPYPDRNWSIVSAILSLSRRWRGRASLDIRRPCPYYPLTFLSTAASRPIISAEAPALFKVFAVRSCAASPRRRSLANAR